MAALTYKNQQYRLENDETALACLLRNQVAHPHSCQAGICQACLIKAGSGAVEPAWQEGLPATLKAQGYFLACMAKPASDLHLESADASECEFKALIIAMEKLTTNVVKIKLLTESLGSWLPGQYLNLINGEKTVRSYSIANIPEQDGYIELHIKLNPAGAMSTWLRENKVIDAEVGIRGPFGKCFYYNPEGKAYDILLAGTGTGLAPLIAIVKSAIAQHHQGNITLLHGGCSDDDIYYVDEINALAAQHDNFHYEACVLKSQGRFAEGAIDQKMLGCITNPAELRLYVCGPNETTKKLKTKAFLAGVPSSQILADSFL